MRTARSVLGGDGAGAALGGAGRGERVLLRTLDAADIGKRRPR